MSDLMNHKAIWSNYMRIDIELFEELFNLIETQISKVYPVRMGANVWFCAINFFTYLEKKEILLFYMKVLFCVFTLTTDVVNGIDQNMLSINSFILFQITN